ncbi:acriflavin resistance protein [Kribbella flavida DSM 17836]|uniref:Acriflavin resistance protein n=1 Tax=Kribbella flavida (strain DSM 17836 / JCM 10339 / NBRC 14399) TaxID=479435 RepID=D2PLZ3_KRIFD|nr:efflux RND transporter permease subunit [Kribbella flavida]ADB32573.1 acriflavin resistance protein [Kribbella flavida DSM 17836]
MRWIVASSIKFRRLVVALAVGVMIVGIVQIGRSRTDALPEFTPTTVEVQTEALGLSAEEVEQMITVPLEQDLLAGVAFLDSIESVSLPGLSSVVMRFEPGTDLLDARQVVQERLSQATAVAGLPHVSKLPQMIQPLSSTSRLSMIKLSSDTLTPIDQSVLARWVITPRLMSVQGVANVTVWGFRDRQLQVLVDPQRLRGTGATLAQVIRTTGNALEVSPLSFLEASSPGTGGFIDTVNQRLGIFHEQAISTPQELAGVPLEGQPAGGTARTLGDVAQIVENHQPLIGDAICPGGERCLLLVVEKFPGADTVQVTKDVEAALAAMRPGLGDLRIDTSLYRPASFIESSFDRLQWALVAGGILLVLLLLLLFRDWRRALITLVAIPVPLAVAAVVLYLRDTPINFMVVAGLLLGLTAIVHDAITDSHGLAARLRARRHGEDAAGTETVVASAGATRGGILYAALVVAAAALPFFFLTGVGDAFLPPLVLSYLLAVAASMLVALVLTPVVAAMLLAGDHPAPKGRHFARRLSAGYDRRAPALAGRTRAAVVTAAVVALIGLAAVPFLDTSLRPALKERDVLVHLEAPPGTSLPKMTQLTEQAVQSLRSVPGVDSAGGQVGRAIASDQIVNVNSGEVWVNIGADAEYDPTLTAIRDTVRGITGVRADVLTYSDERVTDVLDRSRDGLVVRVYGDDPAQLDRTAEELRGLMAGTDGVTGVTVDRALTEPTVQVQVDLARAQAAGVKPGDVRRAATALMGGITVGNLFEQQKVFDVVVWGTPAIRQNVAGVENLLIDKPAGGHVRLGDVADVRVVPNQVAIRHEAVAPYLDVVADVGGRDVDAVAGDVQAHLGKVQFPLEYHAELLGGYEEERAAQLRTIAVGAAAAITVLLLLQAAFGSWRLALLAFVVLPLTLCGGLVAAVIAGGTFGLGSVAGLLGVLGIASRVVVLLIRRYRQDAETEFGPDLVARGTRDVLEPTLATVLAVAVLMAPIVVVGNVPGFEIVHAMAVVMLGGLVTTTVVALFVVPVLYLRFGGASEPDLWADEQVPARQEPELVAAKAGEREVAP